MHHNTHKREYICMSFFKDNLIIFQKEKEQQSRINNQKQWRITMIRRAAFEFSTTTHCPSSEEKSHS